MDVPKLRFKEFDGEWEYHQFSEIVNRVSKSSNSNILPKVEFEDIVAGEGRLKKNVANKFDDRKGTLFQPNNILYGKLRPYLKNWLFPKFQGVALGDFWVFEAVNIAPAFLYALIQSENYQRVANDTAGTKMPRSDWKKVSTTKFAIPTNVKEQEKIGNFFEILDKKIQLQQQKIDLLQEQKKGFLQKMFPKAGETQPEIRFDGFAEKWEQNRLGEYGYFYYGKSAPKWSLAEDANTPCVRYGELYTKFGAKIDKIYSYTTIPKENLKFSTGNEVLVPRVGEDPLDFSKCSWLSISDVAIGEMISVYNTTQNPQFMAIYFRAKMKYEFAKRVEGGNVSNLYYSYLEDILLTVPSLQEQKKICSFFEKLDDNINSQKEKLEFLQKQKQGFMQQMFI